MSAVGDQADWIAHAQDGPFTLYGPAVLNTKERVVNQSVTLTLNYQFH